MLAASKVLIVESFPKVLTLPGKDRQNSQEHVDRSLADLVILRRTFLAYLPPFQSYGVFKTLERSIRVRLIVQRIATLVKLLSLLEVPRKIESTFRFY